MAQEPSLLDRWRLAIPPTIDKQRYPPRLKHPATGYSAKHFKLDWEAQEHIHELARTSVALIRELVEFAIPPYDTMVLSIPLPEEQGVPFTEMLMFIRSPAEFFGFLYAPPNNTWLAVPFHDREDAPPNETVAAWTCFVATFILLLNSRKVVVISETGKRKTLARGKPVTYLAYSTIKIDLTTLKQLRRAFRTGTHATPRRHEVMGHFVHRGGQQQGCVHEWEKLEDRDDGVPRWACATCDRKRTWRKAFERGDAGKGFVRQEYEIVA